MSLGNKILMSKGMGKILDNKFVKKVMVPVGNKIIKKVIVPVGNKIIKGIKSVGEGEAKYEKEKDEKNRNEAPEGAYGKIAKGRSTSDGYMPRR